MKGLYFVDRKNISKYIIMLVMTVFSIVFVLTINGVYEGYRRIQIENAYVYSGEWDVKTYNGQMTQNVELICHMSGPSEYIDDAWGFYRMYGCTKEQMNTLFAYNLTQGKWPENMGELVVSEKLSFEGRSFVTGDLNIGDKIRVRPYTPYTEDENEPEEEFTITGFYKSSGFNVFDGNENDLFTNGMDDDINYVNYYRLDNHDIDTISAAREYFDSGEVSGEVNDYLYRAVYNSYGSDYIRQVDHGIKILTWVLVFVAVCIVSINMTYVIDSDKKRNIQLYALGCNLGKIFSIYAVRLTAIILSGSAISAGVTALLNHMLGKRLKSMWHVFGNSINVNDINWYMLPIIALIIMAVVFIYAAVNVRNQIRQKKGVRAGIQTKEIKSTYDLAQINILKNKAITIVFTLSLSAAMASTAFVSAFSKKIDERLLFVTGNGQGYDVSLSSTKDIYDEIKQIDGVESVYMKYGNNMCTTTLDEDNFIEEAKSASNYDDLAKENAYVYVIGLTEEYYEELSMFNELPPYEDFIATNGCLVFNQFISKGDGQVYNTFQWKDGDTVTLTSIENGKTITVAPIANVSMPTFAREVDFLLGSFIVPRELHHTLSEDQNFMYDIYIDESYDIDRTLIELRQLADRYNTNINEHMDEKRIQLDTYNTHMLITRFIEIIVLVVAVLCIWSSVSLERISRRKQFETYKLLGMSKKDMRRLAFAEYMHKLLDALIVAIIMISLLYNNGSVAKMAGFYSLSLYSVFASLALFIVLLIIILAAVAARRCII